MKIGIDARLWNETGVGRYIRSLYQYLSRFDTKNEYIWFFPRCEYNNIRLPSTKWKKVLADIHWHSLAEQLILPWIFYKEKLDLLHFPYFTFPIIYLGNFVVTIHDLIYDHYKSGKTSTLPYPLYLIKKIGYHLVVWTAVKRATRIITLSEDAKKEIIQHYSANPDKVTVTYESGVLEDKKRIFPPEQYKDIIKLRPYLLYVGNAHPHKNIESLILAMKYINKSKTKLRLVLLGDDKFFYPRLKEFIEENNLGELVSIIGEIPNAQIAAWYHFAKGFVSASLMEGFGIPPLEAMSAGCPVMISDIPVFHEVCADAAVYFNQNNPTEIARVIIKTLDDQRLVEELIKKGYQRSNRYNWEKMSKETIDVYLNIGSDLD